MALFLDPTLKEIPATETDKLNDVHFEGFAEFRSGDDSIELDNL